MITGIQHFSFTVSNMEEMIHFFHGLLGLEVTPIIEVSGEWVEEIMQYPGVLLRVCFVATPDNGNIELIEYVAPKGERVDLKTCNVGVAHISFMVDDIQKTYDDLTAKGVKFHHPPIWPEVGLFRGWGICYLKGPDDLPLEMMQAPKGVKLHPATGLRIEDYYPGL